MLGPFAVRTMNARGILRKGREMRGDVSRRDRRRGRNARNVNQLRICNGVVRAVLYT